MKTVFLLTCILAATISTAQPYLSLTQITSVASPVDITSPNDNSQRLFLVEKAGRIRIFNQNTNALLPGYFLDIATQVSSGGERGLLGLAFHPNYATNGHFFVNYTDLAGDTHVSRFTVSIGNPNLADAASELPILFIDQPFNNHNGGDLAFGPDGFLYIPTGDGGSSGDPGNRAQNPSLLLGKMLRIDVNNTANGNNYAIPANNPFIGIQTPNDVKDEIWALGLRNPWRFSFDRLTGDIWTADVGQGAWEELDFQPANSPGGENYGWRCYEGNHAYNTAGCASMSAYEFPIFEYPHSNATGGFSVTGGYVYRGNDVAVLKGWYIMADYVSDNFWLVRPDGVGGWDAVLQTQVPVTNIVTFGEDGDGELYAASLDGPVYVVSATTQPCPTDSTLSINPLDLDTVSASLNLSTLGAVSIPSGSEVLFRAGNSVTLAAEFEAKAGAELNVLMEDCSQNVAAGVPELLIPVKSTIQVKSLDRRKKRSVWRIKKNFRP